MTTTMYTLRNTFGDATISQHRTLAAAVAAMDRHWRAVRRANGRDSYVTYEILDPAGAKVDRCDVEEARLTH